MTRFTAISPTHRAVLITRSGLHSIEVDRMDSEGYLIPGLIAITLLETSDIHRACDFFDKLVDMNGLSLID